MGWAVGEQTVGKLPRRVLFQGGLDGPLAAATYGALTPTSAPLQHPSR